MKKLKITGRPLLIDPNTQKQYTVSQLCAMNCYYEDIIEVDDNYDTLMLDLNLQHKYPELKTYNLKFEEIN
jgi:hypothetical protein